MTLFIAWMRMRQIRRKQHMQLELNFAAVTYHEIRNPLNGTIGWLRFLASNFKINDDLEMKECVNDALVCTEQAFHYLNSLSSMLKLEAGKMVALPTAVDITSVFEAVTAIIRPQLNSGVSLLVNTPKNLCEVLMDATVLTHVIVNLAQNAVRFTKEGAIEVRCDVSANLTAVFSVSDTGCGMTKETLASVFERYKSMSRGGVGIGLHISYKLVKVLGSELQARRASFAVFSSLSNQPVAIRGERMTRERMPCCRCRFRTSIPCAWHDS